ncbi:MULTISPECIES: DUF4396 domain-containing protein [Myxococcaceae]|uniref:DUF4396 domain-containing protein n=1 Tax=Myxococcaceae TaxID=31 RepID=UPI00188F2D9C|nr:MULTISPECIES: DUF4396 domain-containing protein [Myxococcaceae]MBF5046528.1 DUF4396 domain-containing protein [Simulacricoccus sp. 17bor-14]
MDWGLLTFLSEPAFVLPWYAPGLTGAAWVALDLRRTNTPLKPAMKWAWPLIVLFFSVLGLALYLATARAPGIGRAQGEDEKQQAHRRYEQSMVRRVNGAVIHCVAGDGLGIMTGMVIARATGMSFWQEFWFEYAVGFAFGLFIFQLKSMRMMTDSVPRALWMAFRAEFFSMLTVMAGMGAVMTYVTPLASGAQPKPLTWAFWGFGMFGLLVGYLFTFPMNWMLVKVGWKHGMGPMEDAHPAEAPAARAGLFAAMALLGAAALVLPAWLTLLREGRPLAQGAATAGLEGTGGSAPPSVPAQLAQGLHGSLAAALAALQDGRRSDAVHALDAALRAAQVGKAALPHSAFAAALSQVRDIRRALHQGDEPEARAQLGALVARPLSVDREAPALLPGGLAAYRGAQVLDAHGARLGEVEGGRAGQLEVALGGARDLWGFVDLGARERRSVPAERVLLGPRPTLGESLVALPGGVASP